MSDVETLYNRLVSLKQYELTIASDLAECRENLAEGGKSARKQFETTLKVWSKAAKNVNKAQSDLMEAAIVDAHKLLGRTYTADTEEAVDE